MTTTTNQTMQRALRQLIANDAYAMTFQTMGQYRTALLHHVEGLLQAPSCSQVHLESALPPIADYASTAQQHSTLARRAQPYATGGIVPGGLHLGCGGTGTCGVGDMPCLGCDNCPKAESGAQAAHPDDLAVDRFAAAMKDKMAASRAKGRSGWDDPTQCQTERLQAMLREHLAEGDPVDIGNLAMMLWSRGAPTTVVIAAKAEAPAPEWGRVRTVGDIVRNLLTLNQADPIHSAFFIDFDGKHRCRTSPITISRERVIDGKWVDSTRKDVPYATVVWAKPDERAQQAAAPGALLEILRDVHDTLASQADSDIDHFEDDDEERECAPVQFAARKVMQVIDMLKASPSAPGTSEAPKGGA